MHKRQNQVRDPRTIHYDQTQCLHLLTQERTIYFRNAPCAKPALLLANMGDDEQQSLQEVSPIGAPDLQDDAELWVQVAGADLAITEDERRWWVQALRGLHDLHLASLDRFADYVLRTRVLVQEEGLLVCDALDAALPALRWPKYAGEFSRIAPRTRGRKAKWRTQYATVYGKRACFLSKQTPSGVVLSEDELRTAFERVHENIPEACHQVVRDFMQAPGGWTAASARLAECDWEDIKPLFDGLKREKFNLGEATLDFYSERDPELLTDSERHYLRPGAGTEPAGRLPGRHCVLSGCDRTSRPARVVPGGCAPRRSGNAQYAERHLSKILHAARTPRLDRDHIAGA